MKLLKFTCLVVLLSGCGTSEEEAKEELNSNSMTISPEPGTYSYQPWVKFTKDNEGLGSGVLNIKAPGKAEFNSTNICSSSLFENADIWEDCVEVEKSGTLTYFLENSAAESDEKSVEYTVELVQNDITVKELDADNKTVSESKMTEVHTLCDYDYTDEKLNISIQTKSDSKIGSDKFAFILFTVNKAKSGDTIKITEENEDNPAGISVKPSSDDVPTSHSWISDSYTTNQSEPFGGTKPKATCTIEVETIERIGETKGSISCTGLGNYDDEPDAKDVPFGEKISIDGNWQCDQYQ